MFEILIPIVITACLIVIFYTGFYLLYRMLKTKLYNLFGLALFFILYGTQLLGEFISFGLFGKFFSQICLLFLIFFVKSTFYKDSNSKIPLILIGLFIFLRTFDLYFNIVFHFQVPLNNTIDISLVPLFYVYITCLALEISVPMFFLAYKALNVYSNLKSHNIEPWIKKRYLIISISSIFLGLSSYANYFMPYEGGYEAVNPILFILVASALLIFSFGNLIAWVMPERLKNHFNKDFTPLETEELSESELLSKIQEQLKRGDQR